MSVTIIRPKNSGYSIRIEDFVRGKAYEGTDGDIYICNPYLHIMAFSICGQYNLDNNCEECFREVNLEIEVN